MKTALRLPDITSLCMFLLIGILLLPLGLVAQDRLPDGMYSGTDYTIDQRPKPNKIISQTGKKTVDSATARIADPRQNASVPVMYKLSAYPNPAVSDVRVVFSAPQYGLPYQLYLVSTDGKPILQQRGSTVNGVNTVGINVNSYPAGNYFLQLMIGNIKQTIRVVKTR